MQNQRQNEIHNMVSLLVLHDKLEVKDHFSYEFLVMSIVLLKLGA